MDLKAKIIGTAAAVVLVGGGVLGAVTAVGAQQGDATPTAGQTERRARADAFIERVASNLGVTGGELTGAFKAAQLAAVDDALAAGRIDEARAAKMRERINNSEGLGLGRIIGRHDRMQERRANVRGALIASAAGAIGITPDALKTELRAGASVASVAEDKGVSVDDVKSAVLADARTKLDTAVADGKITQARADTALQRLTDHIDTLLTKTRGA